jgi:membrane-anchored mycosin MYCP
MDRRNRGARATSAAAAAALLLGANVLLPASAVAIERPGVDPAALPPDDAPGPDQEMKQQNTCADPLTVAVPDVTQPAPGNVMLDITKAWKFSTGAGVTVGMIDTGVTPNPRFPALFAGGDYVMGDENGGLFDCDSHGTVVASIIAAQPSDPAAKPPPMPPNAGPPPPPPDVEASPFPTTPPPAPPKPSTVTVTAPPPPAAPPPEPPPEDAPAAGPGGADVPPVPPPPPGSPDGVVGVAPDAAIISVRQSSSAFGPARPQPGDNEEMRRKAGDIATLARAIVHLANLGVRVMNISVTACINAAQPIDQAALGAAVRYAAVDKDIVLVSAAGNEGESGCAQNPVFNPLRPDDPRDWQDVSTIVTPAWYSDYVLTVGAVSPDGQPLPQSIAGPWVGVAAPGLEIMGLSSVNGAPINGLPGREPGKAVPLSGTSFATAYTSGVAALVRAKYPNLSAHQIIRRITETAHNPPRGVDNKVGYGVVDPVAALTFDVPLGDRLPTENLTSLLNVPAPPPPPDLRPRHTALIGAGVVAALAAIVAAAAAVRRRRT